MSTLAEMKQYQKHQRAKRKAGRPAESKLSEADRLERIAAWIDAFEKRTSDEEYTDVGDAWDLFIDIRALARGVK